LAKGFIDGIILSAMILVVLLRLMFGGGIFIYGMKKFMGAIE